MIFSRTTARAAFVAYALTALALAGCGGEAPPPPDVPAAGPATAAGAPAPAPSPAAPVPAAPAASAASAPAASAPKSPESEAPLLGVLTEKDILGVIGNNATAFDPCYPAAAKKKSATAKVAIKATFGPHGDANDVRITKSSGDTKVDECVAGVFKKLKFPASKEGSARVNPVFIELGGEMIMQK